MELPITDRSRKHGYIFWSKRQDGDVSKLLKNSRSVRLHFRGSDRGEKNVDWKYRRISIGWKWTRELPADLTTFKLRLDGRELHVTCE